MKTWFVKQILIALMYIIMQLVCVDCHGTRTFLLCIALVPVTQDIEPGEQYYWCHLLLDKAQGPVSI